MSNSVQVKPLRSFEHNGVIVSRRSVAITVDRWRADQLAALGLVEVLPEADSVDQADEAGKVATKTARKAASKTAAAKEG